VSGVVCIHTRMLAPRKTLWSTPGEVIDVITECIPVKDNDVILDVGCGDAKVLIHWASRMTAYPIRLLGIEIDEDRAREAKQNVESAFLQGILDRERIQIEIYCCNALDRMELCRQATIIFLYLIPRGLRRIKPLLYMVCEGKELLQVVTYMSPLPDETYVTKRFCKVQHQPGSLWPLYIYHLRSKHD
jgi:hypothetical protein